MELDELPDGWKQKPLSDHGVATLNPKKSEVSSLNARLEVTFVPMAAVDDGSGTIARPGVRRLGEVKKGYTYFKEGDVIFAKITPCMENGKSAIARGLRNGIGFGSTEFHVVRAGPETQPEWLHLILRSQQVRDDAENAMHGAAGQQRVPIEFLEQLEIPVPPLAEQRRIVARVEALASRLDQARQARQAALAEAESLLSSTVSKAQKKFRRTGKSTVLGEILTDLQYGTSAKASVHPVGTPVIRMGNIQNGRILTDNLKYLQLPPVEFKRYRLDQGDVLINRTNSAELVGKTGLFDLAGDFVFASYLIRLRVNRSIADPAFVNYAINSDDGLAYLRSQGKDAIGQTNINTKQIRQMPITIPPLPAQRELVARLDALRGKLDELQRLQREVAAELAAFTPALLAKAFRGEL